MAMKNPDDLMLRRAAISRRVKQAREAVDAARQELEAALAADTSIAAEIEAARAAQDS